MIPQMAERDVLLGMMSSSVGFVRLIFHPCVYRDPVYFPGLAAIIRECLLKTARIRGDFRDNKSNKDGSAIGGSKATTRPHIRR